MIENKIRDLLFTVRDEAKEKNIHALFSLHREKSQLMRIGNNSVSLNTSENLVRLDIRVVMGRKEAVHTQFSDITSLEASRSGLEHAINKAAISSPKQYDPILDIIETNCTEQSQYDESLAFLDPVKKLTIYKNCMNKFGNHLNYSGSWSSGATEIYLISTANTHEAYHIGTDQKYTLVIKDPDKKWEISHEQCGWKTEDVTYEKTLDHCSFYLPVYKNRRGIKIKPDTYTVIFGEQAIASLLMMAMWTGFWGKGFEEKRGWTCHNKIGDKILGDNVTIVDNPSNDYTYSFGFDNSGRIRKPFSIVENGIFKNLMYDITTAAKYGQYPTGHSLNSLSISMNTDDRGFSDPFNAVKNNGKVLYIPFLHYMNIPNFSKGVFTASSRFNALLLENGQIQGPIYSVRITDTFRNVLCNITHISSKAVSSDMSNTYGRRSPVAFPVPSFIVSQKVTISDCADSF